MVFGAERNKFRSPEPFLSNYDILQHSPLPMFINFDPKIVVNQNFVEQWVGAFLIAFFEVVAPYFAQIMPIHGGHTAPGLGDDGIKRLPDLPLNHLDEYAALGFGELRQLIFEVVFEFFMLVFDVFL